ncbi:hypothetical protein [Persephonella sp.]|nr:hypothetical protein [Persephonella sp.]
MELKEALKRLIDLKGERDKIKEALMPRWEDGKIIKICDPNL